MKARTFNYDHGKMRLTFGALPFVKLGRLAEQYPDKIGLIEGHPDHVGGWKDEQGRWCDEGAHGAVYVEGLQAKNPSSYNVFFNQMMKYALVKAQRIEDGGLVPVQKSKANDVIDGFLMEHANDVIGGITKLLLPEGVEDAADEGNE